MKSFSLQNGRFGLTFDKFLKGFRRKMRAPSWQILPNFVKIGSIPQKEDISKVCQKFVKTFLNLDGNPKVGHMAKTRNPAKNSENEHIHEHHASRRGKSSANSPYELPGFCIFFWGGGFLFCSHFFVCLLLVPEFFSPLLFCFYFEAKKENKNILDK